MKLIGLMPVRNEAWCLGLTLRAALQWCDIVICADHGSTDASREIMEQIADETKRVVIRDDREPEWREMEQRQMLLNEARECGATHIAIVDADEILTGNLLCPIGDVETVRGATNHRAVIRDHVASMPKGSCLQLPMYQLRGSLHRYHANGIWGNRWLSVAFQDDPKLSWSGDKFHSREPQGMPLKPYRPIAHVQGGSFHLWGVSERRLRAKHALYQITEALRWPDKPKEEIRKLYSLWRSPADVRESYPHDESYRQAWSFANVPLEWWSPYKHLEPVLDINADPWQEHEVRKMVAWHGAETFAGLDLFGLGEKY